jgi:hypothetical protein
MLAVGTEAQAADVLVAPSGPAIYYYGRSASLMEDIGDTAGIWADGQLGYTGRKPCQARFPYQDAAPGTTDRDDGSA